MRRVNGAQQRNPGLYCVTLACAKTTPTGSIGLAAMEKPMQIRVWADDRAGAVVLARSRWQRFWQEPMEPAPRSRLISVTRDASLTRFRQQALRRARRLGALRLLD